MDAQAAHGIRREGARDERRAEVRAADADVDHIREFFAAKTGNAAGADTVAEFAHVRERFPGVMMGGLDEVNYRKLDTHDLERQKSVALGSAGKKFILAPGCSVPNDSADEELSRLPGLLGA